MFAARPEARFGAGRPGGHGGPGGPGRSFGKPFAPRGSDRFPQRANDRFPPSGGDRFPTHGGDRFVPRGGDRLINDNFRPHERAQGEPSGNAFSPRKPAGPGASRPQGFKPQRPRPGGYGR